MLSDGEYPIFLNDEQLAKISKEDLVNNYKQLQNCIETLNTKRQQNEKEKLFEIAKLKNLILMKYVSSKEQESTNQFQETQKSKQAQQQSNQYVSFVDPAVNAIIVQLKKELEEVRKKKDEIQNELNAWKFNPESQMSKRLMAKCRKLLQENEELGKIISSGNVAQLEHDLAYHKEILNEACENEQNINSFLVEMDNEMDAMQATIIQLQQRLKAKEINGDSENNNTINNSEPMNTN